MSKTAEFLELRELVARGMERLERIEAAVAVIGHNGGPPLDEPPPPPKPEDEGQARSCSRTGGSRSATTCRCGRWRALGRDGGSRLPAADLHSRSPLSRAGRVRGVGPQQRTQSRDADQAARDRRALQRAEPAARLKSFAAIRRQGARRRNPAQPPRDVAAIGEMEEWVNW